MHTAHAGGHTAGLLLVNDTDGATLQTVMFASFYSQLLTCAVTEEAVTQYFTGIGLTFGPGGSTSSSPSSQFWHFGWGLSM